MLWQPGRKENIEKISSYIINTGNIQNTVGKKSAKIEMSMNIFVDEVPVDMLKPGKGKVQQAYMWVIVGGKERSYCCCSPSCRGRSISS